MTTAPEWTLVCAVEDIVPNSGVCAKVGGEQVAVFRLVSPCGSSDEVFALGNFEPNSKANVLSRGLVGDLAGEIVVASPVYKNHYALKTGACLEEEGLSVPVFAVRVVGGEVFVSSNPLPSGERAG